MYKMVGKSHPSIALSNHWLPHSPAGLWGSNRNTNATPSFCGFFAYKNNNEFERPDILCRSSKVKALPKMVVGRKINC